MIAWRQRGNNKRPIRRDVEPVPLRLVISQHPSPEFQVSFFLEIADESQTLPAREARARKGRAVVFSERHQTGAAVV